MEDDAHNHIYTIAAPIIFFIALVFQFFSLFLKNMKKKKGPTSAADVQLRTEIKQLYKEASTFSQPSTFAQAAKLRRMAAAKEKELSKNQELHSKEISSSYDSNIKKLTMLKVFIYVALCLWFWRSPVGTISKHLVQPFGRFLSWRSGGSSNSYVLVGIIPWLVVSTRVAKLVCEKVIKY